MARRHRSGAPVKALVPLINERSYRPPGLFVADDYGFTGFSSPTVVATYRSGSAKTRDESGHYHDEAQGDSRCRPELPEVQRDLVAEQEPGPEHDEEDADEHGASVTA
jgi:hypothetical protein